MVPSIEERRSAKAYLDGREAVSDVQYDCEVVTVGSGFAWAKLVGCLGEDVPEAVVKKLKEMTTAVKKKARSGIRRAAFNDVEVVIYASVLDLIDPTATFKRGQKLKLKLYADSKGVGGHEIEILEEAPAQAVVVKVEDPAFGLPVGLVMNGEAICTPQKEKSKEKRPKYMRQFMQKVAQEERQTLDGWYDGEVIQRSKTYAWVKPLDESILPEGVQAKLQEMCDGFRKKADDGSQRQFCGGIEDNVVYVANPDLSSKGIILTVGMKVKMKLYTDNKGVGGYDVMPSDEHIDKMLDAIRKNFESEEGRSKTIQLNSVFGDAADGFKDVLWIGECTHAFSVAAGRLCGVLPLQGDSKQPHSLGERTQWCSTELSWPRQLDRNLETHLADNLRQLRSIGAWCAEDIDAHRLKSTLNRAKSPCVRFDTIFWMMPYVPDRQWRSAENLATMMHYYILEYVKSALHICKEDGSIMVVVTSVQCLTWELYDIRPRWNGKALKPEVWWFDVSQFEKHGYQSRFGDGRDRFVDRPVFHRLCDMVAVRWRPQQVVENAEEASTGGDVDSIPKNVVGVTEEEINARKKLLEEVGKDLADDAATQA
eukprot:TRINITY_DN111276_c0_g1_i1.p1 TRINITY_DN111276_c0_g1~~TRINITY_DN111276_c0_g1_i1.p1  ORF type:complete len:595 (+),score=132.48 TRINITY_DN111276_c0_g1_i1:54-1838(+)